MPPNFLHRRVVAAAIVASAITACHDATGPTVGSRVGPVRAAANTSATAGPSGPAVVYVTNTSSNSVSVIDPANNTVVKTISVGDQPGGIGLTPDAAFAYVTHVGSNDVWVIETATNSVVGDPIPVGSFPRTATATPDGSAVWVANVASHTVSVIETATNTVVRTITPISVYPFGIAFAADGTSAYVSRQWRTPVVVNVATGAITSTISGTQPGFLLTATPDGAFAYLTTRGRSGVDVIEFATNTVVKSIDMGCCGAHSVAFTPNGKYAYVSNWATGEVTVVDVATATIVGSRISVGGVPGGLAVTPDGSRVYVATGPASVVSVIDVAANTVLATIPVGLNPLMVVAFSLPFVDDEPPMISQVEAAPNPVTVGSSVDLKANVDDTGRGDSNMASAEYSIDGGAFMPMAASDGAFDEVSEDVTADLTSLASATGVFVLCVRGTDAAGNVGTEVCTMLAVFDPTGGFVTGGGWINSPAGAYMADPGLTGKANFGFVSKYKKGATVPTGNTEFQLKAGGLSFHSSSYDFLVITMGGTNAQYKGSGTINGGLAPGGTEFRFMIWARDDSPYTFRIKIWYADGGGENVVYDNGFNQPIGGGSIVVHSK